MQTFTVGYEGRDLKSFVALLRENEITKVIDVRELPLSRRRGFSKTPLRDALNAAGIGYVHLRRAGNPHRDKKATIERCLKLYGEHLDAQPEVLPEVEREMAGERAVILCVEADPERCHRSVLTSRLRRRLPRLQVQDL